MPGRKPLPTAVHARNRNPGKRSRNKSEPSAGKDVKKPKDLDKEASALWDDAVEWLKSMGVLDAADQVEIEMMCRIYSEWKDCLAIIEKEGRICESFDDREQLVLKTHPAVRQASDASKRLKSILSDFGMNPVARVPLGSKESKKKNRVLELIQASPRG